MKRAAILVLVLVAAASAAVKAYDVEPYRNNLAVETLGTRGVGEYVRMCLDSLTKVSVWTEGEMGTQNSIGRS